MNKGILILAVCFVMVLSVQNGIAKSKPDTSLPDRALMQRIWDGWNTLNPANVAQFYASGQNTFFDVAPLKYDSWDAYQQGVKQELADFKAATFIVNDDAKIYPAGEYAWGTATVKYDMTHLSGKRDMGNLRWTVVWQKQDANWLIVHEHVSMPLQ
jgi:ketosteroid isomerase-like protein